LSIGGAHGVTAARNVSIRCWCARLLLASAAFTGLLRVTVAAYALPALCRAAFHAWDCGCWRWRNA
jgi:hypothetical protein